MDFGVSFSPNSQAGIDRQQQTDAAGGGSPSPIQDAIKLLSLRIPSFRSQGGVAALPLLQGSGSMAQMGGGMAHQPGGLSALLNQLYGQMGGGSAPTPNIGVGLNPTSPSSPIQEQQLPTMPGGNSPQGPSVPNMPTQTGPVFGNGGGDPTTPVSGRMRF